VTARRRGSGRARSSPAAPGAASKASPRGQSAKGTRAAKPKRRAAAAPADGIAAPTAELGDKLYYRIGEVAKITGVKPYVLRYWETEFRWMAPQKSRSKQRLYRRKDIETILLVKRLLYEERYTIAGARRFLREMGVGRALEAAEERVDHRAEYRALRDELLALRSSLAEA